MAVWGVLFGEEKPPIVAVGHSMGGAVAVHMAALKASVMGVNSSMTSVFPTLW